MINRIVQNTRNSKSHITATGHLFHLRNFNLNQFKHIIHAVFCFLLLLQTDQFFFVSLHNFIDSIEGKQYERSIQIPNNDKQTEIIIFQITSHHHLGICITNTSLFMWSFFSLPFFSFKTSIIIICLNTY